MKIVGYLKKQPKWKAILVNGKYVHTGWCDALNQYNSYMFPKDTKAEEIGVPILEGTLTLDSFGRGRSSVVYYFKDEAGNKYEAAVKASLEIFKKSVNGVITGQFTIIKQGSQMSIGVYNG